MTDRNDPAAGGEPALEAGQASPTPVGPPRRPDRREFLAWLTRGSLVAVSALALGQVVRFFSYEPAEGAPSVIPVGKPATYTAGTLTYVGAARAYVGRDSGGLYAIDAVCTHLGCLVEHKAGEGFACPCHGSRFAADGQVQNGPANKALRHLVLSRNPDGQVVVDRAQPVAPEARLAANS
jgi:cytochrome b6-f complex iron-sulfur subunit